jgi:radical SAM protein with 4Fe4S-binding SPASM domain
MSIEEIIAALCSRFQTERNKIAELTHSFIEDFADMSLIWIKNEKMRWFNPPAPQSIFWEITAECNLRCLHCVVSADKKLEGELSTEEAYRLINEWRTMGVRDISFSGGEPLLREDFFDLAKAAKMLGFNIQVASNGTLVTPSIAKDFKNLDMSVQVSIDGSTADIYGKFRGRKDAFAQAVNAVDILLKAGIDIIIGTVVTKHNVDDLPDMLNLVRTLGAKHFRLIPFIPYGRGRQNKELELDPCEMKEAIKFLIDKRKDVPFDILTMEFEQTFQEPPTYGIDSSQPSACGGAVDYCTITPLGEVLPCHYVEGVKADNVKDHPFNWIWGRSRFLNYFRSLRISDIKGHCQQCRWLAVCRGGCKAANFSHGDLFQSNRHCWVAAEHESVVK